MSSARPRPEQGFTYVELLIVVIVLGILAAIVLPQVTSASPQDRQRTLLRDLTTVRSQLELYKAQHDGRFPTADGTPAGRWDWSKLTRCTDAAGKTAPALGRTCFGPYLAEPPVNALSALAPQAAAAVAYQVPALDPGDACDTAAGWAIDGAGRFHALSRDGTRVYDETKPDASRNDE